MTQAPLEFRIVSTPSSASRGSATTPLGASILRRCSPGSARRSRSGHVRRTAADDSPDLAGDEAVEPIADAASVSAPWETCPGTGIAEPICSCDRHASEDADLPEPWTLRVASPRRTEPSPEEIASMRADLKRAFDLTDEEADEAMRNITF